MTKSDGEMCLLRKRRNTKDDGTEDKSHLIGFSVLLLCIFTLHWWKTALTSIEIK